MAVSVGLRGAAGPRCLQRIVGFSRRNHVVMYTDYKVSMCTQRETGGVRYMHQRGMHMCGCDHGMCVSVSSSLWTCGYYPSLCVHVRVLMDGAVGCGPNSMRLRGA